MRSRLIVDLLFFTLCSAALAWALYQYDLIASITRKEPEQLQIDLFETFILALFLLSSLVWIGLRESWRAHNAVLKNDAVHEELLEARQLALTDPLTGIGNRRGFDEALEELFTQAPEAGHFHVLALIDLNDFKKINDHLGHGAGDQVLKAVASRLASFPSCKFAGRLGGDEFALLIENASKDTPPDVLRQRFEAYLNIAENYHGDVVKIESAVGVVTFPAPEFPTPGALLRQVDARMYDDKERA